MLDKYSSNFLGNCFLIKKGSADFFDLSMGSHHHQVAALVPDEKLYVLFINAGIFSKQNETSLSPGTSDATWRMMAPHCFDKSELHSVFYSHLLLNKSITNKAAVAIIEDCKIFG